MAPILYPLIYGAVGVLCWLFFLVAWKEEPAPVFVWLFAWPVLLVLGACVLTATGFSKAATNLSDFIDDKKFERGRRRP